MSALVGGLALGSGKGDEVAEVEAQFDGVGEAAEEAHAGGLEQGSLRPPVGEPIAGIGEYSAPLASSPAPAVGEKGGPFDSDPQVAPGFAAFEAGDLDAAEREFSPLAAERNRAAMFGLGLVHQQRGDFDAAVQWYAEAAQLGEAEAANNLGTLLAVQGEV